MQLLPEELQEGNVKGNYRLIGGGNLKMSPNHLDIQVSSDNLLAEAIKSRLDAVCSPSCNRVVKSRLKVSPTSEEYVQLNKYRLMAEIGQVYRQSCEPPVYVPG